MAHHFLVSLYHFWFVEILCRLLNINILLFEIDFMFLPVAIDMPLGEF